MFLSNAVTDLSAADRPETLSCSTRTRLL